MMNQSCYVVVLGPARQAEMGNARVRDRGSAIRLECLRETKSGWP